MINYNTGTYKNNGFYIFFLSTDPIKYVCGLPFGDPCPILPILLPRSGNYHHNIIMIEHIISNTFFSPTGRIVRAICDDLNFLNLS